eukprot:TRINITY_DN4269_c0_g3_i7.p1 TRINITY_DN4269_c0_g3~~TRINITY_DN4269_c0_g3_i7.p1  ORF type:complete len:112 (+),score=0.40 TRINITY_DN4269_c0_g3_i7:81-416(+)
MTVNGKFSYASNDEAVIAFYDTNDDFLPTKVETARSVSFARNYLICNIIVQCLLFALIVFFVLAENWYTIKVTLSPDLRKFKLACSLSTIKKASTPSTNIATSKTVLKNLL